MRFDTSMQVRLEQRMKLAPRMIQSMEILQLPLLALQERIEQEMLSNPVLELEEPTETEAYEGPENGVTPEQAEATAERTEGEQVLQIGEDNSKKDDFQRIEGLNDFGDYLDRSEYIKSQPAQERDRKLEAMQNTAAPDQSLTDRLLQQWSFIECPPLIQKAGRVIIEHIEDTGYLSLPLEELIEHVREPITKSQMENALRLVQTLEPSGVGARALPECLLIQLRNDPADRGLEIELVTNYLKDIENNRFPAIVRKTGRSLEEIKAAIVHLGKLHPRPGLAVSNRHIPYIIPDIFIEYDEIADQYTARLADGSTPNLRINNMYASMIKQGQLPTTAKEFLQNSVRSAKWLIESIEQRKATLLRVVNLVIRTQRDFLDHGPLHLHPLPMVDVAAELGIHVGTVSRAVSGKYMQTPNGIFPLRYFFSGGTETAGGESVSWDAIKAQLQEIVNAEDKNNPLNDDELVEKLTQAGITVARRTVAKYRALLNIPPARRRKEF